VNLTAQNRGKTSAWSAGRIRWAILLLAALAIGIVALLGVCGGGDSSDDGPRIKVVTTLPLFADFARAVGGDRVEVTSLIPLGVNPDSWQPAPGDAERVAEADIAFANGHDFEPAAMRLLQENLRPGVPLVQIAGDDEELEKAGGEIFHGIEGQAHQPVLWMSIQNGKAYAYFIRTQLSRLDPAGEEEYARNTESYFGRVDETERYAFERLDSIPPENKKLITPDNSLEYFGSYYAIELTAQLSLFPGQELTQQDVARISDTIRERGVVAVFVQPYDSNESEMLRRAAEDAAVPACTLYSDSLDDKVSTYVDLIRFDADELARCFGGET
jgi:ABC-type Zn uptake system ZnuABC Zn-binding protein ZnuA